MERAKAECCTETTESKEGPSSPSLYVDLEITNESRLKYSEGKNKFKKLYSKEDSNKYVTQNVLKLLPLLTLQAIWLGFRCQDMSQRHLCLLEILSVPRTLGPECHWEPGLVLGNWNKLWRLQEKIFFYSKTVLPLNWSYLFPFSSQFEIYWGRWKQPVTQNSKWEFSKVLRPKIIRKNTLCSSLQWILLICVPI